MTHLGIQLCSNMESTVTANDLQLLEKVSYTIYQQTRIPQTRNKYMSLQNKKF